jgi:hypothetical protein
MGGYQAKPAQQTSSAEHQTTAHVAARVGAGVEPANGASGKAASLLQLQQALDQSPRVQAQVALQRALDQRAAAGGKAPQKKPAREKPALQMKGIAINDDAGLEHEADAMGARASATPANRLGAWTTPVQRARKPTPMVGHKQGPLKELYEPTINKYSQRVGAWTELKPDLTFEQLHRMINALENAIQLRKQVGGLHGGSDAGHQKRIEIEESLLEEAIEAKRTAPREADLTAKKAPAAKQSDAKEAGTKGKSKGQKKNAKKKKDAAAKKELDTKQAEAAQAGSDTKAKSASASAASSNAGGGGQGSDKKDIKEDAKK